MVDSLALRLPERLPRFRPHPWMRDDPIVPVADHRLDVG
jgi:hypothetical protein